MSTHHLLDVLFDSDAIYHDYIPTAARAQLGSGKTMDPNVHCAPRWQLEYIPTWWSVYSGNYDGFGLVTISVIGVPKAKTWEIVKVQHGFMMLLECFESY